MMHRIRQLLTARDFQEAIRQLDELSAGSDRTSPEANICRTQALIGLGIFEHEFIDRAIDDLRANGDNSLFAEAKYLKARLLIVRGELTDALEELIESYVCYKRIDDRDGMSHAAVLQSYVAYQQADYKAFFVYAERANKLLAEIGDVDRIVSVSINLTLAHLRLGEMRSCSKGLANLEALQPGSVTDYKLYHVWHVGAMLNAQLGNWKSQVKCLCFLAI